MDIRKIVLADWACCTGCSACCSACPVGAIAMLPDGNGFLRPVINKALCCRCGACKRVCPGLNPEKSAEDPLDCLAARTRSRDDRLKASSGGIFAELAKKTIVQGGSVYGAVLSKDLVVRHARACDMAGVSAMRGSKYASSELGETFKSVAGDLEDGLNVLFSGTPCQVAGLKRYLQKDYDSLLCVALICHGVPSRTMFAKLISDIGHRHAGHGRMVNLSFRDKRAGWEHRAVTSWYEDGSSFRETGSGNAYLGAFLERLLIRPSCERCAFADGRSGADVTLGDFWGAGRVVPNMNDGTGVSAVIVHTEKGRKVLGDMDLECSNVSLSDITRENPSYQATHIPNPFRKYYWPLSRVFGFRNALRIYSVCQGSIMNKLWRLYRSFQIPRNLLWQLWHGQRLDYTWSFSGLPRMYMAGGNNPLTRLLFRRLGRTSSIRIGRHFSALSLPTYNALGVFQRVLLRTCSYGAELVIGNNVGMSGCSVCASEKIVIGDNTIIGTGAIITDSDLHPVDPTDRLAGKGARCAPVTIGENCFIGARAIILKGVTIGNGVTIGAGAVVAKSIPDYAVAVGNPARVISDSRAFTNND